MVQKYDFAIPAQYPKYSNTRGSRSVRVRVQVRVRFTVRVRCFVVTVKVRVRVRIRVRVKVRVSYRVRGGITSYDFTLHFLW